MKSVKQIFVFLLIIVFLNVSCSGTVNGSGKKNYMPLLKKSVLLNKPEEFTSAVPEKIFLSNSSAEIKIYARSFAQGEAVYIEVIPVADSLSKAEFSIQGESVPLTRFVWGYRGFYGISPSGKTGTSSFFLSYVKDEDGIPESGKLSGTFNVSKTDFPSARIKIDLGKFSDKSYYTDPVHRKHIEESGELKAEAFKSNTPDSISNVLSHPRDFHKITSEFWKSREYLSYKIENGKRRKVSGRKSIHRGIDLRGKMGEPVYAIADGMVVLSHDMFYEGKMILIDHGDKVFSYYMHMSERNVQAGGRVKSGDVIGAVGSTGMSTAPHLHVSFIIRGVQVDPLSVLSLPVSR